MSAKLDPEKALIFRITHVDNVPWILKHGLTCRNAEEANPSYVTIGSEELIAKRHRKEVPGSYGGTLSDYVPFYFTPFSVMMYNIITGYNGMQKRAPEEIVIFVSSLHQLKKAETPFVFTDGHAYSAVANYYEDLSDLNQVDWELLKTRDFKKDPEDPGKLERYQAEALVHQQVPLEALAGIGCVSESVKARLDQKIAESGLDITVQVTPKWYF